LDETIDQDGDDEISAPCITTARGKESEIEALFANLSLWGAKPLILSLIPKNLND